MRLALDAKRKRPDFATSRKAEQAYARDLRRVARQIGDLVRAFPPGDLAALPKIERALHRYSEVIEPWARAVAGRMVEDVQRRDVREWEAFTADMGRAIRDEIRNAPTGYILQQQLDDSVRLITSLPTEAAQRVHVLTMEAAATGARAKEIAAEIMRTGEVTQSRAMLIARTETARTQSLLTTARAQHIGCTHFKWQAILDTRTRPSHRKMNGRVCEIASPPIVDGQPLLPGQIYNCRCTMLPILPD